MRSAVALMTLALAIAACGGPEPPRTQGASTVDTDTAMENRDGRLVASARIALPPDGLPAESLPDAGSPGALALQRYCTQCHALPAPSMHGAVDWPGVLRRMWVRIDMMRGELGITIPSSGERIQLLRYMTANALQVTAQLPEAPGRAVFESTCSRCHVVPDPRIHSPADWPAVVTRMETNMERMRVRGILPDETRAIVRYLELASARR